MERKLKQNRKWQWNCISTGGRAFFFFFFFSTPSSSCPSPSAFFLCGERWCTYKRSFSPAWITPAHSSSRNQTHTHTHINTKIERFGGWEGSGVGGWGGCIGWKCPRHNNTHDVQSVCLHGHSAVASSEPVSGGGGTWLGLLWHFCALWLARNPETGSLFHSAGVHDVRSLQIFLGVCLLFILLFCYVFL